MTSVAKRRWELTKESAWFFKTQRAFVDAWYLLLDFPKQLTDTHSSYGALIKYGNTLRQGKEIKARDFKGHNLGVLRKRFAQTMGHDVHKWWSRVDLRYFYAFYVITAANLAYMFWTRYTMDQYQRELNRGLHLRRPRVGKDYMDDEFDPSQLRAATAGGTGKVGDDAAVAAAMRRVPGMEYPVGAMGKGRDDPRHPQAEAKERYRAKGWLAGN